MNERPVEQAESDRFGSFRAETARFGTIQHDSARSVGTLATRTHARCKLARCQERSVLSPHAEITTTHTLWVSAWLLLCLQPNEPSRWIFRLCWWCF
jgi:hypothetical protein